MKAHLPKITAAFGFSGIVHQGSWLYNTASSAILQVLVQKVEAPNEDEELNAEQKQANQRRFDQQRQFIHDAAVATIAWHALKMGSALLSGPSLGAAAGLLYDVGAFVTLNEVIYNNSSLPPPAEPREKKD